LFPFSVKIESFSVGEDPAFSTGKPFAQAKEVFVSAGLWSLITGSPEVKRVVLDKPALELIKNQNGKWNFSSLGSNGTKTASSDKQDQLSLNDVEIKDGTLELTDQLAGTSASGTVSIALQGREPANTTAVSFSGNGTISSFNLRTPALAKPLTLSSASLKFTESSASLTSLSAAIGSTAVHGNISVKNFSPPELHFSLAADNIDTAELLGPETKKTQSKPSNLPQDDKQPSLLNEIRAAGTLAAKRISSDNIVLTNVQTSCKLEHGVVQLSPLTADLFSGKQEGALTIDLRPAKPLCSVRSKLSGVDSNALLSAVSSLRDTLYGTLGANTSLSFTLGQSADLAKSLNGNLDFQITNGELKNVNIMNEIAKIGRFLNSASAQSGSGTALRKFYGNLSIHNGVASTNNLTAALDVGSLAASGQLNSADQGLNMHVNAILANQVSQTVGGSSIGGFLNTALSNSNGELVIPVNLRGTTSHPVFTPDLQAMAQMKAKSLLPTSGDPTQFTSGIVGAISGKKGAAGVLNQVLGGQQNQNSNNEQDRDQSPVNSILKQFGKKPGK